MTSKICSLCGVEQDVANFYRQTTGRDGLRADCKTCFAARRRRWYEKHRDVEIDRVRKWQQANRTYLNEYRKRLNASPARKRKQRDSYYRRTFGISADDFDALLEAQGGGCALCGDRPEREASLHVDHCHESGEVRGILCLSCNQGLGKFRESAELLERAAAYVREHRAAS